MNDHQDIEKTLKKFHHNPDARVKCSVLSAYEDSLGREVEHRTRGFWRRPVPLYAAAAVLIFMIGVSFVVGQRVSIQDRTPVTSGDIEWSVAQNDLL